MRSQSYEEDEDWDDGPVESLVAGSPGDTTGGVDVLAELLLDMTCAAVKLNVLLREADEKEWRAVRGRLSTYVQVMEQRPLGPRPSRKVGFVVVPKAKQKRKGGK